jgi:hypothetical protein
VCNPTPPERSLSAIELLSSSHLVVLSPEPVRDQGDSWSGWALADTKPCLTALEPRVAPEAPAGSCEPPPAAPFAGRRARARARGPQVLLWIALGLGVVAAPIGLSTFGRTRRASGAARSPALDEDASPASPARPRALRQTKPPPWFAGEHAGPDATPGRSLDLGALPGTTEVLVFLGRAPVEVPSLGGDASYDIVAMMDEHVSAEASVPAATIFGDAADAGATAIDLRLTLEPLGSVGTVAPAVIAEARGRDRASAAGLRVITSPEGAAVYLRVPAAALGLGALHPGLETESRSVAARRSRAVPRRPPRRAPPAADAPTTPSVRTSPGGAVPHNPYDDATSDPEPPRPAGPPPRAARG